MIREVLLTRDVALNKARNPRGDRNLLIDELDRTTLFSFIHSDGD